MATIASLVGDVQPMIAAAVPESAIKDAILWSARDFLRKSRWLRETITVDVVAAFNAYVLAAATSDCEVFNLQAAQFEGEYLTPATQEEVRPETTGYYFFVPARTIQLSWTPASNSDSGLLVRCLLNLTTSATTIPDSVLSQWNSAISYGALARLLGMRAAPWFDQGEANKNRILYESDLVVARTEAEMQSKAYAYGSVQG